MIDKPTEIKYSHEHPPVFARLEKEFGAKWEDVCIAYGDTLHFHETDMVRRDLIIHEATHLRQQEFSQEKAAEWWQRWFNDPTFRLKEEIEAYQMQYRFLAGAISNRDELAAELMRLARELSAPEYGPMISYQKAFAVIKAGLQQ